MGESVQKAQRGGMNLAPDHFRPGATKQKTAAPKPPKPEPAIRERRIAPGGQGAVSPAPVNTALKTGRKVIAKAARWTTTQSVRLAVVADSLLRRRPQLSSDLAGLDEAARYAAISNRLGALAPLSESETDLVRVSTPDRRIHQAGSELVVEGERGARPMFIARGWACRVRVSRSGVRQILGLLLPGDGIALRSADGGVANTTVAALTAVETVDAQPVLEMAEQPSHNPGVSEAMRRVFALEEEFLINHVFRLGAMGPHERVAHMLTELHWRLQQSGLATARDLPMPLKTETFGDALAMTPRAVENALRALQRSNIIRRGYCELGLLQSERLRQIGGFEPPALHTPTNGRQLIVDASATGPWDGPETLVLNRQVDVPDDQPMQVPPVPMRKWANGAATPA